jgi:hypothetical protein
MEVDLGEILKEIRRESRDGLAELDKNIKDQHTAIASKIDAFTEGLNKHAIRLNSLEVFRAFVTWLGGAVTVALLTWLFTLIHP